VGSLSLWPLHDLHIKCTARDCELAQANASGREVSRRCTWLAAAVCDGKCAQLRPCFLSKRLSFLAVCLLMNHYANRVQNSRRRADGSAPLRTHSGTRRPRSGPGALERVTGDLGRRGRVTWLAARKPEE
jgi:hypothetical protein